MKIIKKYAKELKYDTLYKNIDRMYNDFKDDKVTSFMKAFLKNFDGTCKIFAFMTKEIINDMELHNMYGVSYAMKL